MMVSNEVDVLLNVGAPSVREIAFVEKLDDIVQQLIDIT
jgi:hypothetical protein